MIRTNDKGLVEAIMITEDGTRVFTTIPLTNAELIVETADKVEESKDFKKAELDGKVWIFPIKVAKKK